MPLREVTKIEPGNQLYLNYKLKTDYNLLKGDVLKGNLKRAFTWKKEFKDDFGDMPVSAKINEMYYFSMPRDFDIWSEMEKRELKKDDYIEVVWHKIIREEGKEEDVYPGENRELMDFDPEEDVL